MRLIMNLIWLLLSGIWLAIAYVFFGIVACIFIITIPAGVASFRMANYALWPFGRSIARPGHTGLASRTLTGVSNVVWFVVAGLWLALTHLVTAVIQAITIVGIPLAVANVKMIPVTCFPFGKRIVATRSIPYGWEPALSL